MKPEFGGVRKLRAPGPNLTPSTNSGFADEKNPGGGVFFGKTHFFVRFSEKHGIFGLYHPREYPTLYKKHSGSGHFHTHFFYFAHAMIFTVFRANIFPANKAGLFAFLSLFLAHSAFSEWVSWNSDDAGYTVAWRMLSREGLRDVLPRIETDEGFRTNLVAAVREHPAVRAAEARFEAAISEAHGVNREFYAPVLSASAGYATGAGDVPGISLSRVAPSDAVSFETGVEAPIGGGIYAGGGVAERVLTESEYGDDLRQSAIGARVRVPLLQDRGYGLHGHEVNRMKFEAGQYLAEYEAAKSDVARAAVLAWLEWLESIADAREIARAVERAEKLYEQTEGRFRLQDVAGYQIFPAKYEVALRKEELEDVRHRTSNRLTSLHEHLARPLRAGESVISAGAERADELVAIATNIAQFAAFEFSEASILECHERYVAAEFAVSAAEAEVRLAREKMKDSLDVSAGLGWRGESDSGFFGNDELETARNEMYEIGIVWKRPLDKSGARMRVEAAEARVREAQANLRLAHNEILSEFYRAETTFAGARGRLELAQQAVEEARKALEAEEQRFGLGEGTSRNVLDAQKDLTSATRRSVAVSGETARALVNLVHAAGRSPERLITGIAPHSVKSHVTTQEH